MAVINAQAQAALSTINFIQSVGFNANKEAITVSYTYNTTNATTGLVQTNELTIPVLTIMPIPYIRVSCLLLLLLLRCSLTSLCDVMYSLS